MSSWFDGDSMQSFFEFQVKFVLHAIIVVFFTPLIFPGGMAFTASSVGPDGEIGQ